MASLARARYNKSFRANHHHPLMDQSTHNKIVSFFWAIADDVLRDLSRHRTKATPRFRRHHSPTRRLCDAAKQAFYNTSKFTFRDLKSRATRGAKRLL